MVKLGGNFQESVLRPVRSKLPDRFTIPTKLDLIIKGSRATRPAKVFFSQESKIIHLVQNREEGYSPTLPATWFRLLAVIGFAANL